MLCSNFGIIAHEVYLPPSAGCCRNVSDSEPFFIHRLVKATVDFQTDGLPLSHVMKINYYTTYLQYDNG
jgi:hypothetical protein